MSDYVRRAFRAQLNSTLESLLRTAVVEINRIFESSLCDHQVELTQKAEEISSLHRKLEKVERKLKRGSGGDGEKKENHKDEAKKESRESIVATNTSGQISGSSVVMAAEVDFEVPDDWCAPLGCEDVVVQALPEEDVCPSVSLRPLSVSLWRIPAIKQEVEDDDFEPHLLTSLENSPRRSPTDAASGSAAPSVSPHPHTPPNEAALLTTEGGPSPEERLQRRLKRIQEMSLPLPAPVRRGPGRPPGSSSAKKRLQAIKQEQSEIPVTAGRGQRAKCLPKTLQGNGVMKSQGKKKKISTTESGSEKTVGKETTRRKTGKTYSCKFCRKVFDTQFGRSVHVRSHKKCVGCQKTFPFPSSLRVYMQTCRSLKKMNASNKLKSVDPPETKPLVPDKDKQTLHSRKEISTRQSTPTSHCNSSVSPTKDMSTSSKKEKRYSCPECHKKFGYMFTLRDHIRLHTGEKPFACARCPQRFRIKYLMKMHMHRVHKEQKYGEANGDVAWTVPVEEYKDEQVKPSPVSKVVQLAGSQNRKKIAWEDMGRQGPDGFTCLVCERVLTSKYSLIQHYRIHTGEKPVVCERCGEKFRCHPLMSMHRKKCCGPWITCQKCGKKFPSQRKCTKHMVEVHKDRSYECQLCGKGFTSARRLSNHYERVHV